MKRTLGLSLILFVIVFSIPKTMFAQDVQAVDSLFFRGVSLYREGQYQQALQLMKFLDRVYPNNQRTTAVLLMEGKSLYKLREYQRSLDVFEKIVKDYPKSQYFDDALYGMATVYYRMNSYKEAVGCLMDVIEKGKGKRLLKKAAKLSSDIMDFRMGDDDLKELLRHISGERPKAAATLRLARREIDKKHFQSAKEVLQNFLETYPKSAYVLQIEQLLTQVEKLGKGFLKIGVILPLSGSLSEQGKGLLNGIQYAVDLHNQGKKTSVELVVRNSGSRIVRAVKEAQDLCKNEEVVAIIGELESDITAAIGAVAQENGVVLLAPTATADSLTSIGSYIFQLNSSLSIRAKMIAEYAVSGLGLKRFAVLAPADEYGQSMRDSFVNTVNRLGGEVLAEKWYFEGAKDLGAQFKAIREAGIKQMIEDSRLVIVPEEEFDDKYAEEPQQGKTLYVKQTIPELVDSTGLAVTSIDGIFLPVYSEDLPYVIPQFVFYNLCTQVFGGAYWNDIEVLNDNRRYIDGAVFLSDFYIDPSNFSYYRFRDEYRKKNGKTPEKMAIYGYDTVRLLLSVMETKPLSRKQVRDRLAEVQNFVGIRGRISFDKDRVNSSLPLLQYKGGKIIQIK